MARQVKVSGYTRTRRKGQSTIVTMVRPYERRKPGEDKWRYVAAGATPEPSAPVLGQIANGKTTVAVLLVGGQPPRPLPSGIVDRETTFIHTERVAIRDRHVVESTVTYCAWEFGYDLSPVDLQPNDVGRWPLQDLFNEIGVGKHVRVTVEVLE